MQIDDITVKETESGNNTCSSCKNNDERRNKCSMKTKNNKKNIA